MAVTIKGATTIKGLTTVGFSPIQQDFTLNMSLPSWLSVSRASAANYYNNSGTLVSAATNVARFDYNPSTLASRGLLLEPAATNLARYSEQIDNSYWSKTGSVISANAAVAPDGNTTADKWTPNNGSTAGNSSFVNVISANLITASANTAYTASVYVKATGITKFDMYMDARTATPTYITTVIGTVDLSAQTITINSGTFTNTSGTIQSLPSSWYRITITGTTPSNAARLDFGMQNAIAGNGSDGVFVWGIQVEAGSVATSYIQTVASTANRSADIATLSGTPLNWMQGSAGTVVQELMLAGNSGAIQYGIYGNGVSPVYLDGSLVVRATNGTNVLSSGQTAVVNTAGRAAMAWSGSGRSISWSGSVAATDANSFGSIGSTIYAGSNNAANSIAGWIRVMAFYNFRIDDVLLQQKSVVGSGL